MRLEKGGLYVERDDGQGAKRLVHVDELPAAEREELQNPVEGPRPKRETRGGLFVDDPDDAAPPKHVDDMTPDERDVALGRKPKAPTRGEEP